MEVFHSKFIYNKLTIIFHTPHNCVTEEQNQINITAYPKCPLYTEGRINNYNFQLLHHCMKMILFSCSIYHHIVLLPSISVFFTFMTSLEVKQLSKNFQLVLMIQIIFPKTTKLNLFGSYFKFCCCARV